MPIEPPVTEDRPGIAPLDLLLILASGRKTIAKATLVFATVGALIAVLMPNVYTATTTFIPPGGQQLSPQSVLAGQIGAMAGLGSALGGGAGIWVALLKSANVAEYVAEQNKGAEFTSRIELDKSGLIKIEVDNDDPKLAANIANSYIAGLLEINKKIVLSQAGQRRLFYEQQLKQAREGLAEAEVLTETGLKTGDPSADSVKKLLQTSPRAISDTSQQLRARIAVKQIEISAMRSFATDGNINLKQAQDELESLEEQLSALEGVATPKQHAIPDGTQEEQKPQIAQQIIDQKIAARAKIQDIRFYDSLISLLTQQYEQARLDEAKEPTVFQVVDVAVPPTSKSKPKRSVIILVSAVLGFVASAIWIFLQRALVKLRSNPESSAKLEQLAQSFPLHLWYKSYGAPIVTRIIAGTRPFYRKVNSIISRFRQPLKPD